MLSRSKWYGLILVVLALGIIYASGKGAFVPTPRAGSPEALSQSPESVALRGQKVSEAARTIGVATPKQILFGDLHVHTTFSFDAFQLSLPMAGGEGAHPVADACDYARHCSALDFWSINDHGITLTPRRWAETVESIRECNDVSGDETNPDLVSFLGWEWTQVGPTPEEHWGHKNVVLRDLEDGAIPTRPITAGLPPGAPDMEDAMPSPFLMGLYALATSSGGGDELVEYTAEISGIPRCPDGIPVRDLPSDCIEAAPTPAELFDKLDDWGHAAIVIPHGTAWGFYTPPGSSWDKQLTPEQHDPKWQRIIEIYSGHGNSEEYRPLSEISIAADGTRSCPAPNNNYLPACWRAGEIIEERCRAEGTDIATCEERAIEARQFFVDAKRNGGPTTVPGTTVADWQDAGQCRDCFQPAFNLRPRSTAQYILALGRDDVEGGAAQFRFGVIASSDNHSARPGTGYKEVARDEFTEARFANFVDTPLGAEDKREPVSAAEPMDPTYTSEIFSVFETERGASFFLTGGLAAVHSQGRSREDIWDALQRREVYGTSGPRILLWFDILNAPGGASLPMGSEVELATSPIFQVRAVGSFEQKPGCPADIIKAMDADRISRLCQDECYNPGDRRRAISRIEVVRIRPQRNAQEEISALVDDPWQVFPCPGGTEGCQVAFTDPDFERSGRDALYYIRAIEEGSMAIGADPLGCEDSEDERCTKISACSSLPDSEDCLAETEQRAWSSPIFVGQRES
ncbi:MAG: DUF3604 domain-containing protein [Myxococcota bacterium]|nr:DUF3604 domain-containing protein [Myxococcota bacterium]